MAEKRPQNLANHARVDPLFHYVLLSALLVALILALCNVALHYNTLSAWILLLLTFSLVITAFRARVYALTAQTRVIRLEERDRLAGLLPEGLRQRIPELSEQQLVALRFASDDEAPGLVEKTLAGNLGNSDIKKAIVKWRPDYFRV
jgi:uncharacterized protein (DUF58 family)